MAVFVLLLSLFRSVVCSQTFPYVSFMGQTLANHSYVDLSLVGDDVSGSDSVQCHTDLESCCSGLQGIHRGDWYSPGSTDRLPFSNEGGNVIEQRLPQRVDLRRRNSAISPVGIYHCDIPTVAVHDDDDRSVRATVYVGLYTGNGGRFLQHLFTQSYRWIEQKPCPCMIRPSGVNNFARYALLIKFL